MKFKEGRVMKLRVRRLLKYMLLIALAYTLVDQCNLKSIYHPVGPQVIWSPM